MRALKVAAWGLFTLSSPLWILPALTVAIVCDTKKAWNGTRFWPWES